MTSPFHNPYFYKLVVTTSDIVGSDKTSKQPSLQSQNKKHVVDNSFNKNISFKK